MNTEDDVIDMITEALYNWEEEYGSEDSDESIGVRSYEEVGMLTRDSGMVLTIGGEQFQITVVKV